MKITRDNIHIYLGILLAGIMFIIWILPSPFPQETIQITTPIDTIYTHIPSYVDPRQYHIEYNGYFYVAKLPSRLTEIGRYKNVEEAQKAINEFAYTSKKLFERGEL